ncbi:MAG: hypothetical protein RJB13_272 [Pseudomonadota bacterium]|jgi:hypothetical protein
MYLATVHIILDLEPEVTSSDREKVLRAIRDKLKSNFGQRITVRSDEEASIWVAWLDENYTRLQGRLEDILERVDSAGQARVLNHTEQWYAWFEGQFQEVGENFEDLEEAKEPGDTDGDFMPTKPTILTPGSSRNSFGRTIIYQHDDESEGSSALGRSVRKQIRLPTRK